MAYFPQTIAAHWSISRYLCSWQLVTLTSYADIPVAVVQRERHGSPGGVSLCYKFDEKRR